MHLTREAQVRRLAKEAPVTYMVFDLLWLDGHSLMDLPYDERRARAGRAGPATASAGRRPSTASATASALLAATREQGLEGVVAKRAGLDRTSPGRRTRRWLKVKNANRQELVIGGWLPGEGRRARAHRRAAASACTRTDGRAALRRPRRHRLHRGRARPPRPAARRRWSRDDLAVRRRAQGREDPARGGRGPSRELVCEVEFLEWTRDGRAARAVLQGAARRQGRPSSSSRGASCPSAKRRCAPQVDGRELRADQPRQAAVARRDHEGRPDRATTSRWRRCCCRTSSTGR